MRDLSEQDEGVTVLRRRVRSDLFAAVAFQLVVVAFIVWVVWGTLAFERNSWLPILGAFLFVPAGLPLWLKWFRSRALLRELATIGEDAQSSG